MSVENSKAHEIKRLTTPLIFKNSKAYDIDGNIISCIETLYDVRYVLEPKIGVLTDDEILQYAPKSKSASKVRLNRGIGNMSDVLLVHESLPWVSGLYYIILIGIAINTVFTGNKYAMLFVLILFIIPLIYMYYVFNLNNYVRKFKKSDNIKTETVEKHVNKEPVQNYSGIESLKKYEKDINNMKVLFDVKEEVVKELIEKRFAPPQITYDKFIAIVDSSHKLFYKQVESANNIINLAAEDTPRVQNEIKNKISAMHTIIDQIENLTNELVINISNEDNNSEDVKNLLNDMENLIDSVKEY